MSLYRGKRQGNGLVLTMGFFFVSLLVSSFAVDMAMYFDTQNKLQTTSDAAALAAAHKLFNSTSSTANGKISEATNWGNTLITNNLASTAIDTDTQTITFGYYDMANQTFSTTPTNNPNYSATNGYNSVEVVLREDNVPTLMAKLMGITEMSAGSRSRAIFNGGITTGTGLRPVYVCQAQLTQALQDGNVSNNTIRIYGSQFYVDGQPVTNGCPPAASGNWGFADLRANTQGAPGANDTRTWFESGFPDPVVVGNYYSTQPGNFISNGINNTLNTLRNNQTVIQLPVLTTDYTGNGSNVRVKVVDIVSFVIDGYQSSGSANSRYIEGHFVRATCSDCTYGASGTTQYNGTTANIQLVQ